jgi:hypothetical protein
MLDAEFLRYKVRRTLMQPSEQVSRGPGRNDEQTSERRNLILQVLVSVGALGVALVRLAWPGLGIDSTTIGLLALAGVPWLAPIFKSIEGPGGWKFVFQEVQRQGEKVDRLARQVEQAFAFMGDISAENKDELNKSLTDFDRYLRSLGIEWEGQLPKVRVVEGFKYLGLYDPQANEIHLSGDAVGDKDFALKEYVYRALHGPLYNVNRGLAEEIGAVAVQGEGKAVGELLSGLATYFTCSFNGDSRFARKTAQRSGYGRSLVYLEETRRLDESPIPSSEELRVFAIQLGGEVWGSAFWEVRGLLGPSTADKLIAEAWKTVPKTKTDTCIAQRIAQKLVALVTIAHPRDSDAIRASLEKRGIAV